MKRKKYFMASYKKQATYKKALMNALIRKNNLAKKLLNAK